jgi:hypothetical protein
MKKLKGWKFSFKRDAISIRVWTRQKGVRKNFVSVFRVCKTGAARGVKKTKKKCRREVAFCCWFVTSRRSLKEFGSVFWVCKPGAARGVKKTKKKLLLNCLNASIGNLYLYDWSVVFRRLWISNFCV